MKDELLRHAFRLYPFSKGRYRLMKWFEKGLGNGERTVPFEGCLFGLDLSRGGLQRSFYFFMPERYEPGTQRFLGDFLKPGMTALDIGAHIGLLTLLMARRVGPSGRVFSFEPVPENFRILERNLARNGFSWVKPVQAAVADRNGHETLHADVTDASYRIESAVGRPGTAGRTRLVTLDGFLDSEGIKRVDLVKIDAETSEPLVIQGARRLLSRRDAPTVICEIHRSNNDASYGKDRVRNLFYELGYRSRVLDARLAGKPYLSELAPTEPVNGLQNVLFIKNGGLRGGNGA